MPALHDRDHIRQLLRRDPVWSLYALADLQPSAYGACSWFTPGAGSDALALVYRGFGFCVLFAIGPAGELASIADEFVCEPELHLQIRPELLALLRQRWTVTKPGLVRRMVFGCGDLTNTGGAVRLTTADVPAIAALYADGAATGESPDFFFPGMVEEGLFYGVFEGGELVSAAGTHVLAPAERTAAIGNVYTRRDARGRGLAAVVVGALTQALGPDLVIGLNVRAGNDRAMRVYERLGYRLHCEFYEGVLQRS